MTLDRALGLTFVHLMLVNYHSLYELYVLLKATKYPIEFNLYSRVRIAKMAADLLNLDQPILDFFLSQIALYDQTYAMH